MYAYMLGTGDPDISIFSRNIMFFSISEPKRIWISFLKCLFKKIFAQNHNILDFRGINKAKELRDYD